MINAPVRRRGTRFFSALSAAGLAGILLTACAQPDSAADGPEPGAAPGPDTPTDPEPPPGDDLLCSGGEICNPTAPPCDRTLSVAANGPALLVRDPAVLAPFRLERVLQQLIDRSGDRDRTPEEMLQRLFDTENTTAGAAFPDNVHCDAPDNPAFRNTPAVDCPRAEGALAWSRGLFVPGDPDYFAPVALVNRFDLTSVGLETCGEYRIVYAKSSGRTDPDDRVFLIFEGALAAPPPNDLMTCWPVARMWAALEAETDPARRAARLEAFYFDGLPGFPPLVDPEHFGRRADELAGYGQQRGQVRLSQRMQAPWEMREFHFAAADETSEASPLVFLPVTVKGNPAPGLFDPTIETQAAVSFRDTFVGEVANLGALEVTGIRTQIEGFFSAGESAIDGPAQSDYLARAMSGPGSAAFLGAIAAQIAATGAGAACPPEDPLTAEDIVNRATVQSCAGCHAPAQFLGPERKIGCGLTWPSALGEVHIDEHGALSPALTEVFLPRRAAVLTTFLQACDPDAIRKNLQPFSGVVLPI